MSIHHNYSKIGCWFLRICSILCKLKVITDNDILSSHCGKWDCLKANGCPLDIPQDYGDKY